jgi:DNA-binding PadR family transcriptional regulator
MKLSKEIIKGSLPLVILEILSDGDEYGYNLAQEIRKRSNDLLKAGDGTLYPAMYKLENKKLIKSYWNEDYAPKRKYYLITKEGKSYLKEHKEEWREFIKMLQENFKFSVAL